MKHNYIMKLYNIFDAKDKKTTYLNPVNRVERKNSPFKEIINHEDYSKFAVSFGDNEKISLDNSFQLQINVTDIGIFSLLFDAQYFTKDVIIPEISKLKAVTATNSREAINKVNELFTIVKPYNPLMIIYDPIGPYAINELYIAMVGKGETVFMLPEGEGTFPAPKPEVAAVKEEAPKVDTPKPAYVKKDKSDTKKPKTKDGKKNNWFKVALAALKTFFEPMKEDKFHFIFAVLASFIIGFTAGIGVFNAVIGKGIAVFFFICCTAGLILNAFVYSDLFKVTKIKSLKFCLSVLITVLGLAISIIGTAIFYNFQTSLPEEFPGFGNCYAIFIPVALAIVAISTFVSIPIRLLLKKKDK